MIITRNKGSESGYDYSFKEDNKTLHIMFCRNLDLYWSLETNKEYETYEEMIKELYETFTITKENYQIYTLFKTLLDEIKEAKVYNPSKNYITEDDELIELPPSPEEIIQTEQRNKELKNEIGYQRIIDGESINWHSDDEPYEIADVLRISEEDDKIILEFYRPELKGEKLSMRQPNTVTIRFRNSGSYYLPFNIVFMRMYLQLQEYDPDLDNKYHQIHIEELPYQLEKRTS